MNTLGFISIAASVWVFALTFKQLRPQPVKTRVLLFLVFDLLSGPFLLFSIYYLHVLPERAWFYTLRSWRGSEFLVVFLGCASGACAALLPRSLLMVPLFGLLSLAVVPYIKPILWPIPDSSFQERWQGETCLQSTPSTCGPASVCTILRRFGVEASEQAAARAAFSYEGGTEAWYLARYVRSKGFIPRFEFRDTFSPDVGLPAMVGVRVGSLDVGLPALVVGRGGNLGHFIAVLDISGDQVTLADPMRGEEHLSVSRFRQRYEFTGFHMVIAAPKN